MSLKSLEDNISSFQWIEEPNGTRRKSTDSDIESFKLGELEGKFFTPVPLTSSGYTESCTYDFEFGGKTFKTPTRKSWVTTFDGMQKLIQKNRLFVMGSTPFWAQYLEELSTVSLDNVWDDTRGELTKVYVVQTTSEVVKRCVLMTTDPGDLVFDPTCGSGTTAFVAEQFGRRWITTDTSRIALNIAKTRLMTATLPYYKLYDTENLDIRQGFVYKAVPHVTLKSLANDEPPATEPIYDKPEIDNKRLRVSGPFTVETLQNFEPVSPAELEDEIVTGSDNFEQVIKDHLLATGVKNGRKDEQVMFSRVEILANEYIHAEGFYQNGVGEKKAYFHIGPKFGTVSKNAVNEAIKACRTKGDAQWLIILGFSFESDIEGGTQTMSMGTFEVTKARIHDDLLQEGLKKKPAKSAASFVTIGEPDIFLNPKIPSVGDDAIVEIKGLDIYDPIKDEVKARDVHDIAYWMVDDNYDGSNFVVKQVFFCGGEKKEFEKWKKGIDTLAKDKTRARAEKTLKIEIDDEAFDRVYGHRSHPIKIKHPGQKIAVRVISQFGEESMKILTV